MSFITSPCPSVIPTILSITGPSVEICIRTIPFEDCLCVDKTLINPVKNISTLTTKQNSCIQFTNV